MDYIESSSLPFLPKLERSETYNPLRRKYNNFLSIFSQTLIYLLAGWGLLSILLNAFWNHPAPDVYRPKTLAKGLSDCDCGITIEQALARDCVYDTLSAAWLPPVCRDDELTAEFDKAGPNGAWSYFRDNNGTVSITKAEIGELGPVGGSFWATNDWHIAHCLFNWQKYVRMRKTGAVMEARFDSIEHAKHCGMLIQSPLIHYSFLIEVPVLMNSKAEFTRITEVSQNKQLKHVTLNSTDA